MKEKLWNKPFTTLLFISVIKSVSLTMITPVLTKHAMQLGASLAAAGTIAGLFAFAALFSRPASGIFADRINHKYLLCVSTGFMCLSIMLYSVTDSLPLLIFARILHGGAFSFSGTVIIAFTAAVIPKSRLGEGLGYQGASYIFAMAAGPVLGLFIGEHYGFRMTFFASAVLIIAAVLIILFLPNLRKPVLKNKKISRGDFISLKLLPLALIGGLFSLFNGITASFLILLGDERGIYNIGIYFTVNAICLLIIRSLAGKLIDRKSLGVILIPCLFIAAVAAVFIGSAASIGMIIAAAVLKAIGQGSGQPAVQTACMKMLPAEKSGLAASTFYIGADLGQGFGPMLGGAVSGLWGYSVMFYCCAGFLLCGIIIFNVYNKILNRSAKA